MIIKPIKQQKSAVYVYRYFVAKYTVPVYDAGCKGNLIPRATISLVCLMLHIYMN